ncbi:hypothetical protein CS0771_02250 [Catellatospora sp. IY07-71]|uniref:ParB N-terminal domain-containing protein n=1 Tax=Catellatospora sp. IY07-71 TaxID=2728827 RepID=UPI001BB44204|nr:ParB N-terminal domain-containing protein [Catellatospora sp. IY07-71]BCJ70681.1 hypothetical protein CS0771_02250 [Catellatospora sp. IY07-71]
MLSVALDQERVAYLDARQASGHPRRVLVAAWPREDKELPQVEVDVKWLRFSTLNHRTRAEQLREMHQRGRHDLFTADPLGEDAQTAQYEILRTQSGFSDLKDDLRKRGQLEPAIVTADGVLINGNRRSAALLSLFQDDDFLNARYVKCLVLPKDATIEELVDLEAELQVARDFKQGYSWINEAILIDELYDRFDKSYAKVAARMHRSEVDVRGQHEKLQQVRQLVELSRGARMLIDFHPHESAFDELVKATRNKPSAETLDIQSTYFLGTLAGVEYRKLRHLKRPDAADLILHEIEADPNASAILRAADTHADDQQDHDPLDDLLGDPAPSSQLSKVLGLMASRKPDETLTLDSGARLSVQEALGTLKGAIVAAANEADGEQKDQNAVGEPLKRLTHALGDLKGALAALPKARRFDEWDEKEFLSTLQTLSDSLEQLRRSA